MGLLRSTGDARGGSIGARCALACWRASADSAARSSRR